MVAKLVCVLGPANGTEYTLAGDEAVVGRATENAVPIPDTSVSRRHVLLKRLPGGWAASDMGSGNGTSINGEVIAEETPLRNGDVISLGDTELKFVDVENSTDRRPVDGVGGGAEGGARPRPVPRASRVARGAAFVDPEAAAKKRRLLIRAGVGLGVVVVAIIGVKVFQLQQENRLGAEAAAHRADRARLGAIFQEGKNLVREGKWADAKAKFEEMSAIDSSYPTLADYLEHASKEVPNQANLEAARQALAKGQVGAAKAALDKVTPDTQQYQQLRAERVELDAKIVTRLSEGRALMDNGGVKDLETMRKLDELAADVLAASPDNRDATELKKQAEVNIAELTKVVAAPVPVGPRPWLDVSARFRDGDVSGAFSLANVCAAKRAPQCVQLVAWISSFSEQYKRVESLTGKELGDLVDLDGRITGGGESKNIKPVKTKLAGLYYKSATSAKAAGEWARAADLANKVLKVDPGHAGAQGIVTELRSKAKDLYLQAYSLKETSPDEAVKLFKDVLAMTARDDETHRKAEGWVDKLQR